MVRLSQKQKLTLYITFRYGNYDYKNLTLDDTLSYEEAIAAYRTITGACSAGTRDFLENRLPSPHKDKYSIREIIELTRNEYGGEIFKNFLSRQQSTISILLQRMVHLQWLQQEAS